MHIIIRKIIDIREGELNRLLFMSGYIFVIIASYNVVKPMTRSLFISKMGLNQLPLLYMLLAVGVALFIAGYLRFSSRLRLDRLLNMTMPVLMACLLLFRWMLQLNVESPFLYYGLFIWASIYGVLTTSQYWLIANYVFNARAAKRLFPVLTSFALAGAIMGGYFTKVLVKSIGGTNNLAFICIGLLIIAQVLMNLAWRNRDFSLENIHRATASKSTGAFFKNIGETFSIFKTFKHLNYIITIVALTYVVVQIADFQFVAFASEKITDTDELTGFLGLWLSNLSILALVFQLLFTGNILRRFGVGVTILFLPVALFITSAGVLISYGLLSVLSIKVGDGTFRHSINKVGMELLYLPLPQEIKRKTKTFIDMFVDRFARGVAGLILLVFYTWLGLSVAQISLISMLLITLWFIVALSAYREYVNSFRHAIARREIDLDAAALAINDKATIDLLITSLTSRNDRQVIYALQVLESVDDVEWEPALRPLLKHLSADVRRQTLILISAKQIKKLLADVEPLLQDENENVRRQAAKIVVEFSSESEKLISRWIESDDLKQQSIALFYLAEMPDLANRLLTPAMIESFLKQGDGARRVVAEALGVLRNELYFCYVNDLLHDRTATVRNLAIKSAGETRAVQFVPVMIQHLASRTYRKAARQALAGYGDSISEQLTASLKNPAIDREIRISIPKVLSLIGSQRSVDILLSSLDTRDEGLRYQLIKALSKLRANYDDLNFDKRVDYALLEELKKYFRVLATAHISGISTLQADPRILLLSKALKERLDDHLERVFRLLGLCYSPGDMYNAFTATNNVNSSVRANAIEFLDNILSKQHKKILLPIVENLPAEQVLQSANGLVDDSVNDCKTALSSLICGSDAWLSACTIYHVGVIGSLETYRSEIEIAGQSENRLVKETARMVLNKFV